MFVLHEGMYNKHLSTNRIFDQRKFLVLLIGKQTPDSVFVVIGGSKNEIILN